MNSLNKVVLIGNVGRDPEIRYTQQGEPIASFSLATTERWKDKAGNDQERTEWHNVSVFGGLAKVVRDYVTKGSSLYLEGSLRTDEWTDKDGNKRKTTKVNLSGPRAVLIMLGGKRREEERPAEGGEFQATDADVPF